MCGACGSGVVRAPWEVALAGGAPADLRRRAEVAAALTEGRVRVRPWGPAGYLLQPRTAPVQAVASLGAAGRGAAPASAPRPARLPALRARSHRLHHRPARRVRRAAAGRVGRARADRSRDEQRRRGGAPRLAGGGAHRTARRRARRGPRVVRAHRAPDRPGGRRRTRVGAGVAELGSRERASPSPGRLRRCAVPLLQESDWQGRIFSGRLDQGVRRSPTRSCRPPTGETLGEMGMATAEDVGRGRGAGGRGAAGLGRRAVHRACGGPAPGRRPVAPARGGDHRLADARDRRDRPVRRVPGDDLRAGVLRGVGAGVRAVRRAAALLPAAAEPGAAAARRASSG